MKLYAYGPQPEDELLNNAIHWHRANCLYLEPAIPQKFRMAIGAAAVLKEFCVESTAAVAEKKTEHIRLCCAKIEEAQEAITDAVKLPPIQDILLAPEKTK